MSSVPIPNWQAVLRVSPARPRCDQCLNLGPYLLRYRVQRGDRVVVVFRCMVTGCGKEFEKNSSNAIGHMKTHGVSSPCVWWVEGGKCTHRRVAGELDSPTATLSPPHDPASPPTAVFAFRLDPRSPVTSQPTSPVSPLLHPLPALPTVTRPTPLSLATRAEASAVTISHSSVSGSSNTDTDMEDGEYKHSDSSALPPPPQPMRHRYDQQQPLQQHNPFILPAAAVHTAPTIPPTQPPLPVDSSSGTGWLRLVHDWFPAPPSN